MTTGLTNEQRGVIVRFSVPGTERPLTPSDCPICKGLFEEVSKFADLAVKAGESYEFSSFLVGTKIDAEILDSEERLWAELGAREVESIKSELNREVGKLVEARLGRTVDFANPEMVFLVDTRFDQATPSVAPMFVYGRYRKFSREIPQTRWPCRECRGKGCPHCDGKGRMYEQSVQDLIGPILMRCFDGEEDFFHGMGREDIDARMLGNGRPFVVEIRKPRIRNIDFSEAEAEVNRGAEGLVEVEGLRPSDRAEMRAIKEASYPKTYRVWVRFQQPPDDRKLKDIVRALAETPIRQLTPNRVSHRRANLERRRTVRRLEVESVEGREVVFVVEADSGTYIKELMHGDEGRTQPNVASIVGIPCEVTGLDVIRIGDEGAE